MAEERFAVRLGVIVPASNTNLEPDVIALLPPGVCAHFDRIGSYEVDSIPDLAQLGELATCDLESRVRQLLSARVDVLAYGCTSASYAMGVEFDHKLAKNMEAWSSLPAVTAARAVVEAVEALGVRRVALCSPYEADVQAAAVSFLEHEGLEVVGRAQPDRALTNREQADVSDLARQANAEAAEALVLSCTDMRAMECVSSLERNLGKPVITSNQALVWAALNRAGVSPDLRPQCGMLMSTPLSKTPAG